jgi:hypothetical protein
MMQQPVLLSPKFVQKSLHIFTQLPLNITAVCGIDCLAYQDEFFVNNSLNVKENDEYAPDFDLRPSSLFSVSESLDSPRMARAFFLQRLNNNYQSLCRTFPEICSKCDAFLLSGPSQNHSWPDT